MLAIVDYQAGNLTSVRRALNYLQIPCTISSEKKTLRQAQGIIFPGVGAAGSAMHNLHRQGLDELLKEEVANKKPLLGICLGCQIILDFSPENNTDTLKIIPGQCLKFAPELKDEQGLPINIPHMGWNSVELEKDCPLFTGLPARAEFYFVHSYYPYPEKEFVLGTTSYGLRFCSVLGRQGLWAVQFHPEKSGRPGLSLLQNFYNYCLEVEDVE